MGSGPIPSAVAGLENVTYTGFDALTIPRGSRHKAEAFEFIAYVNRQDVSEKLNMMHGKISPFRKVSDHFKNNHPNPYIAVFDDLTASSNSRERRVVRSGRRFWSSCGIRAEGVSPAAGAGRGAGRGAAAPPGAARSVQRAARGAKTLARIIHRRDAEIPARPFAATKEFNHGFHG